MKLQPIVKPRTEPKKLNILNEFELAHISQARVEPFVLLTNNEQVKEAARRFNKNYMLESIDGATIKDYISWEQTDSKKKTSQNSDS